MIFGSWARRYYELGLVPLPLGKPDAEGRRAKAAFTTGWNKVARDKYSLDELENYIEKYGDRNIGIACGTILFDNLQIVAIDVDNEEYVEYVRNAFPYVTCGKKGAKGITWFALAPKDLTNKKFSHKTGMLVEILADGSQTVIPPSIHPDTKSPYQWVGESLHSIELRSLPVITDSFCLEMQSIISGNGQYFIGGTLESGEEIPGINNMMWAGVGGGGNTYDSRLRAVAHMVATGWPDEDIVSRIRKSQKDAVEKSGETFNWPDCERETQQQIDDARKKHFDKGAKKVKTPPERVWAEWLTTQYDWPICYADLIYNYVDGFYVQIPRGQLSSRIVKTFSNATAPKAATAVNTFCDLIYRDEFGSRGSDKICLLNGTLEVMNQVLRPWSSDDELLYKLDVEWNPDSECPEYDKFVEWVFDGDAESIKCWDEFCGLSLVDDVSFQKALFLLGPGANGKSTLASVLNGIHCRDMVSTIAITELDNERKVTSMVGKLINISTEQSRINSITDTVFKQIVGGDPITVRRLYSEAENNIVLKVRFLCLANELPSLQDSSEAMKRRLIILNCPNIVEEGNRDPNLINRLLSEKSGVLRRWVRSLADLKERGHFTIPGVSDKIVSDYMDSNDPIGMWAAQRLIQDDNNLIDIHEVYMDYSEWAKNSGFRHHAAIQFWRRRIERLGYKVREIPMNDGGKAVAVNCRLRTNIGLLAKNADF